MHETATETSFGDGDNIPFVATMIPTIVLSCLPKLCRTSLNILDSESSIKNPNLFPL